MQGREQPTGQYAPDLSRVCKCGHTLGHHLAEGRIAERACTVDGCACQGFKRASKRGRNPVSKGRWVNHGKTGWYYEGTGWGSFYVKKGAAKWYAFQENFGASNSPTALGSADTRLEAQFIIEGLIVKFDASKNARDTRKPNPRARKARATNPGGRAQGYRVFKAKGLDVRFLGSVSTGSGIQLRWFPTQGNGLIWPTKGDAVKAAKSAPAVDGWQLGVTPWTTTIATIVNRLRGKV